MKVPFLLLIILTASVTVSAQAKPAKPVAHKFDEFNIEGERFGEARTNLLRFRADRVKKRMRLEPGKQLMLIGYRARISDDGGRSGHSIADELRWQIGFGSRNEISISDGGIRENATIEVWIVPKGAEAPKPTPEFTSSEAINCPSISIDVFPIGSDGNKFDFVVRFPDATSSDQLKWSVYGGQITARFLDRITVTPPPEGGKRVEVVLEVADLPMPCNNRRHATALFGVRPRLVDSFPRITNEEFAAKLDGYFSELSSNPDNAGIVHIYGGRTGGVRDIARQRRFIENHIAVRRFDRDRIQIVDAGFREEMQADFWMVGPGAENPVPKPTLDKRFVVNTP